MHFHIGINVVCVAWKDFFIFCTFFSVHSSYKWSNLVNGTTLYDPKPTPNARSRNIGPFLYNRKLNSNTHFHNTFFKHFLTKKEYYGNESLGLSDFIHFYTILDTFVWFPYTFTRPCTTLYDSKLNPKLYSCNILF